MFTFAVDIVLTDFSLVYSAAVVKLKTLTSLLAADELSNKTVENMRTMQKVLVYIVTIISNFMDLEPSTTRISQFILNSSRRTLSSNYLATVAPNTSKNMVSDRNWQKKAIVSVMEAGGVNWLVGKVIFSVLVYDTIIVTLTRYC